MAQTESAAPTPVKKKGGKLKWILLAIVALIVIIAIATSGGDDGATGATPSTGGPQSSASAGETAPAAPADDPLSDGGWTVSDIQVSNAQFGPEISARITNNEGDTRTGVFTLTIFSNGQRIADAMGSASDVEGGGTATVQFISSSSGSDSLPGDPATYTYELQSDL